MGFKQVTLELACSRGYKVHDYDVDMECEVVRIFASPKKVRYLLRYPDGVTLPITWDEHVQGMTERAKVLKQSRSS